MAFGARVYQIMIASPSDVKQERDIIRQVIYEWNEINASKEKVVLLPVGWETHASPAVGDRPQAILNKEILERCDLLIGIFWTRIGSPTGKAVSGTVEEISKHIETKKPAMIYFSDERVSPSKFDSEQYNRLEKYKTEIQGKALTESYDNTQDFKDKFRRQLAHTINEHDYFQPETDNDNDILEDDTSSSRETIITLSEKAQLLLIEAAAGDGSIIQEPALGKFAIFVNNKQTVDTDDTRSRALWKEALSQLETYDLIQDRGYKGEIFEITARGYEVVDQLQAQ